MILKYLKLKIIIKYYEENFCWLKKLLKFYKIKVRNVEILVLLIWMYKMYWKMIIKI